MILTSSTVKGHRYWEVATSRRIRNRPRKKVLLYLGRLDGIDAQSLEEKRARVAHLANPALLLQLDSLLVKLGHPPPLPSLRDIDLAIVRSYGPELTLVKLAEELHLVDLIEAESPKGGGPPLGKMTLALAIYANLRPGSLWRFVAWYRRSPLPLFLDLPPDQVTYEAAQETGLKSGTLYPLLMRLSEQGLLESRWQDAERPGLPPRHIYRLTAAGLAVARDHARSEEEAMMGNGAGVLA